MRMGIGRGASRLSGTAVPPSGFDQGVIDDFDDQLAGRDGAQHLLAHGLFADLGDEVLDHGEGDVGFQKCQADFPQRFGHVGFAQGPAAAELVKNLTEFARQGVEHVCSYPNANRAVVRTLAARRTDVLAPFAAGEGESQARRRRQRRMAGDNSGPGAAVRRHGYARPR